MSLDNYEFILGIGRVLNNHPEAHLTDLLTRGQVLSKSWLIDELLKLNQTKMETVFICAGWYGSLAAMLLNHKSFDIRSIRSFDIDPACAPIADTLNKTFVMTDWKFKASTADIYNLDYSLCAYDTLRSNGSVIRLQDSPDVIINTSCEHLQKFSNWWDKIPSERLVVLQSNNMFGANGHVNCSQSLTDFSNQAPMKELLFSGSLAIDDWQRFMLIGRK